MDKLKRDRFRFFAPVSEFTKAKTSDGRGVYEVKGIISDDSEDADEEILMGEGLDFSDFNWINWNHNKEPKFLIGEPTKATHLPGKGTFMEGVLYEDSEVAKQAIDLMKILQKSGRRNKLSWSIEGQVIERDLINPKKVKKAKITAVALCPTPKNGNTWAELVEKGFTGDDVFQKPEELDYDRANGGDIVVIDEESGEKITVDMEGNIHIEKCQTTQNSAALIPESVEGNKKKLEKSIVVIASAHKNNLLEDQTVIEKAIKMKKLIEDNNI